MILGLIQNVSFQSGGFHQGIHPRIQTLPCDFSGFRGGAVQIMASVLNFSQTKADTGQRFAIRTVFRQMKAGKF